jgi:hypothetical protein
MKVIQNKKNISRKVIVIHVSGLCHRKESTECTKMIGAVSSCHNGFGNARKSMFPHRTKQQALKVWSHAQSHSPLSLAQSVTLQKKMATPEEKAFCVLPFAKHESVVCQQH